MDRFAPVGFVNTIQHFVEDVLPAVYCCLGRFADCNSYYRKRPSDDGTRFNPPPPGLLLVCVLNVTLLISASY